VAFRAALEPLLRLRQRSEVSATFSIAPGHQQSPGDDTAQRSASGSRNWRQELQASSAELARQSGAVLDEDRAPNPDDYFHFDGTDVTDLGLGEAARRSLLDIAAGVFSFQVRFLPSSARR